MTAQDAGGVGRQLGGTRTDPSGQPAENRSSSEQGTTPDSDAHGVTGQPSLTARTGVAPQGNTEVIDCDGGRIAVVLVDGDPRPILRLASDALGLSWPAQYRRSLEDPAISVAENA